MFQTNETWDFFFYLFGKPFPENSIRKNFLPELPKLQALVLRNEQLVALFTPNALPCIDVRKRTINTPLAERRDHPLRGCGFPYQ